MQQTNNKQVKLHATLSLFLSLPPGHGFRAFAMRLGCQGSLKRLPVTVECAGFRQTPAMHLDGSRRLVSLSAVLET